MNDAPPTIAVSVPVRGGVQWLTGALESLAMQATPPQVALLDASGDPSVKAIADPYEGLIDYRYHRAADGGQAAAIQSGWDALDADVYGWLNADDRLMPGALTKIAAAFAANPEVDVVYGHALLIDASGGFSSYFPTITLGLDKLPVSNIICQPACFVRRRALESVGGLDTQLHYAMDWDLWLRLRDDGRNFLFLDDVLAVVIDHADTKTNTGGARRYAEIGACLQNHVSGRKRIASLLRHRGHDIGRKQHRFGSLLLRGLAFLLDSAGRGSRDIGIGGLRLRDQQVAGMCRVPLPWFETTPARRVLVTVSPPGEYSIRCNGCDLPVSNDASDACLSAELPASATPLYDIEIAGARPNWRLISLRLVS